MFVKSLPARYVLVLFFGMCTVFSVYAQTSGEAQIQADSLFRAGNFSKAITYYKKAPVTAKNSVSLGRALQVNGNVKAAVKAYEKALAMDSLPIPARYELAKIYTQIFQIEKARKHLKELTQLDPLNPVYTYRLGLLAQKQKDSTYPEYFKKAFAIDPAHVPSIKQLAKYYLLHKPRDSARYFINLGLTHNEADMLLLNLKAQYYYYEENYEKAVKAFSTLRDYGEDEAYVYEKLAYSHWNLNQHEEALENFRILIKRNNKASWHYDMAEAFEEMGLADSAIARANTALELKKVYNINEYLLLARLHQSQKDYKNAIKYYQFAVNENPKYYIGYYQIAFLADQYYADATSKLYHYQNFEKKVPADLGAYSEFVKKRISELKAEIHMQTEE